MGENCREGCGTRDHSSYAECLRGASIQMNALVRNTPMNEAFNKTTSDLQAYRSARVNGIQPEGTTAEKVKQAERASKLLGRAYNANTDPPANMITTKKSAQFTNRIANANS